MPPLPAPQPPPGAEGQHRQYHEMEVKVGGLCQTPAVAQLSLSSSRWILRWICRTVKIPFLLRCGTALPMQSELVLPGLTEQLRYLR